MQGSQKLLKIIRSPLRILITMAVVVVMTANLFGGEVRYQQVRIYFESDQQLHQIFELGLDGEGARVKHNTFVKGVASERAVAEIRSAGFRVEILEPDLARFYERQLGNSPNSRELGTGSMGGYYTYDEITNLMDSLHANYPSKVGPKSVSDNPWKDAISGHSRSRTIRKWMRTNRKCCTTV